MPSIAALRHAPWSLSKIQCALRCPLEFHLRYVDRLHEPEVAPDTRLGKVLHSVLEAVLHQAPPAEALAIARRNLLDDEERARLDVLAPAVERFAERIVDFKLRRRVRTELVEHRLAVAFDLAPVEFTARDAFFRGVWDVGYVFDDGQLAVVDHKTGVRRPGADYADQLKGYAVLAAAHMGAVRRLWLGLHFLVDAALEWAAPVDIDRVHEEYAPRLVAQIEDAARAVATRAPNLSTWCLRCSYKSICPAIRAAAAAELPETEPELVDDALKSD